MQTVDHTKGGVMIVSCAGCGTKYKVSEEKIGPLGARVRCPKCRTVFEVKPVEVEQPESLAEKLFGKDAVRARPPAVPEPPAQTKEPSCQPPAQPESVTQAPSPVDETPSSERVGEPAAAGEKAPAAAVGLSGAASAAEAAAPGPKFPFKSGEEEPRTLARALVSDILFYNRDSRDKGLVEGKTLAYLGKEIVRSWDTYKERVGLETAVESDFFRQAVNEILGEGRDIL